MSGRGGGRDRFRRDYPSRHEDNRGNGISGRDNRNSNSNNPPSRHLWVGNLSHNIVEEELAHHFLRYGPLENVAFQPGRSYAFINFRMDEDAIDALRALQGFPLAGNPLRIEFAKAFLSNKDHDLGLENPAYRAWELLDQPNSSTSEKNIERFLLLRINAIAAGLKSIGDPALKI
ncbi:hypothetical protein JHK85_056178 [Glycine max]|nr:hypothetical protein JHK85_056178 [Glycine max]